MVSRSRLQKTTKLAFLVYLSLYTVIFASMTFVIAAPRQNPIDTFDPVSPPNDMEAFTDMFNDFPTDNLPIDTSLPVDFSSGGFLTGFESGLVDPNQLMYIIDQTNPPRYWRYSAYDDYGSGDWSQSDRSTTNQSFITSPPPGAIVYRVYQNISHSQLTTRERMISLWPSPEILDINLGPNGFGVTLQFDNYDGSLMEAIFQSTGDDTVEYIITDVPQDLVAIEAAAQNPTYTPASILAQYTNVPSDLPTVQAIADMFPVQGNSTFEIAQLVMEYIRVNYEYDIDLLMGTSNDTRPPGLDPVEWFLTRGKGTAAHFATALALVLRRNGIASRPVMGFTTGTIRNGHREIYAMHVHVWNEVWVPTDIQGNGIWVQFDSAPRLPWNDGDDNVIDLEVALDFALNVSIIDRFTDFQSSVRIYKEGSPFSDQTVMLHDITDDVLLETGVTDAQGWYNTTLQFNNSAVAGWHQIAAIWGGSINTTIIGLRGPTNLTLNTNPIQRRGQPIQFWGNLTDAINDKGIANQYVGVVLQNWTLLELILYNTTWPNTIVQTTTDGSFFGSIPLSLNHRLGNVSLHAYFTDPLLILGNSTATPVNVTVFGWSTLNLFINPTIAQRNSTVDMNIHLELDNGTVISGQSVNISWINASGSFSISIPVTDIFGDSATTYDIPYNHSPGQVLITANFTSPWVEVLGTSSYQTILITETGIITLSGNVSQVYRGSGLLINGTVINQDGNPVPNAEVELLFNQSPIVTVFSNLQGEYVFDIQAPLLPVGEYLVNASILNPSYLIAISYSFNVTLNGSSQINILQLSPERLIPQESMLLTGTLQDELTNAISNEALILNLTIQTSSGWTSITDLLITDVLGGFSYSYMIPVDTPEHYFNISIMFQGTIFLDESQTNASAYVFTTAQIQIQPSITTFTIFPQTRLGFNGSAYDGDGMPIVNRYVGVYAEVNQANTSIGTYYTDSRGFFYSNFTVPDGFTGNITFFAVMLNITDSSSTRLTYQVMSMQDPTAILALLLNPTNLAIIGVSIGGIIILIYFVRTGRLKLQRKKPVKKIDINAMIANLTTLVNNAEYREAINYSYKIFQSLLDSSLDLPRGDTETALEYAQRIINNTELPGLTIMGFTTAFETSRYSNHEIGQKEYGQAMQYFAEIYQKLTGGKIKLG